MDDHKHEMLYSIQALTLACRDQTGARIYHEVQAWPDGATWSTIRIVDEGSGEMLDTTVVVAVTGHETRVFGLASITSLAQQHDALLDWIAANRRKEVA